MPCITASKGLHSEVRVFEKYIVAICFKQGSVKFLKSISSPKPLEQGDEQVAHRRTMIEVSC